MISHGWSINYCVFFFSFVIRNTFQKNIKKEKPLSVPYDYFHVYICYCWFEKCKIFIEFSLSFLCFFCFVSTIQARKHLFAFISDKWLNIRWAFFMLKIAFKYPNYKFYQNLLLWVLIKTAILIDTSSNIISC